MMVGTEPIPVLSGHDRYAYMAQFRGSDLMCFVIILVPAAKPERYLGANKRE